MPTSGSSRGTGIIVLGMHRSGTSLAAEIAYQWGAFIDTSLLIEPNDGNPRGYWEHRSLVKLNDDLLAAVHSSWKVPPTEEGRKRLARLAQKGSFRHRAHRLLATHTNEKVWLWKDPRLSILLPFWKEIWEGRCVSGSHSRSVGHLVVFVCSPGFFHAIGAPALAEIYVDSALRSGRVEQSPLLLL